MIIALNLTQSCVVNYQLNVKMFQIKRIDQKFTIFAYESNVHYVQKKPKALKFLEDSENVKIADELFGSARDYSYDDYNEFW